MAHDDYVKMIKGVAETNIEAQHKEIELQDAIDRCYDEKNTSEAALLQLLVSYKERYGTDYIYLNRHGVAFLDWIKRIVRVGEAGDTGLDDQEWLKSLREKYNGYRSKIYPWVYEDDEGKLGLADNIVLYDYFSGAVDEKKLNELGLDVIEVPELFAGVTDEVLRKAVFRLKMYREYLDYRQASLETIHKHAGNWDEREYLTSYDRIDAEREESRKQAQKS